MSPFRWIEGVRLSYIVETFEETAFGERVESKRSRQVIQMSAAGKARDGMTRVRFSADNTSVADGMFDQNGRLKDVSILLKGPESVVKMLNGTITRMVQHPQFAQFENAVVKINERVTTEVLLSEFLAPLITTAESPEPTTAFSLTYTGHKRVKSVMAAELRSSLTMSPKGTYLMSLPGLKNRVEVNSMNLESTEWVDPSRRYLMLKYEVVTMGFVTSGKTFFSRQVTVTTLDRSASRI